MDTRRSILRKIGSWPITHWVMRKLLAVKWRRMHKAPEVQQRIKAISAAAPHIQEQFEAFVSYTMTLQNKLPRSKLIEVDALPPGTIQIVQIHAMLWKIETGNATASDIEEFRRLAGGPAELATAVSIEP